MAALAAGVAALLLMPDHHAAAQGRVTFEKTPSSPTYTEVGQIITYSYFLENTSQSGIFQISIDDDTIPTVDCPDDELAPGESMTCTGEYVIQPGDIGGSVTNIAIASGADCDLVGECLPEFLASDEATITFEAVPSWTLAKTADPTTYSGAGEPIAYTYVLTNTGNVTISSISLTDDTIAIVTCPASSLAPGADMTCTGDYVTTPGDVESASVTNTATASGTPDSGSLPDATDQATITFLGSPSWTLTKTADPTTYSGAGEPIAYTYVLTNTGNVTISAISLTDDTIAIVTCPATSLAPGADMTCTGDYVTTPGDVESGSVTNTATASGTPDSGSVPDATAQTTITLIAPAAGSITIVKTAAGGDGRFNFSSSIAGAGSFVLETAAGSASRTFANLAPGAYEVTEVALPLNWELESLGCAGDTGGRPTVVDLANRSVSIGLDGGEAITCTFGNSFDEDDHIDQTKKVIHDFLRHRIDRLAEGPDRNRLIRRMPGSLWGDEAGDAAPLGGSGGPVALSGSGDYGSSKISVATSLAQISQAGAEAAGRIEQLPTPGFDVWVEAHFSHFDDDGGGSDAEGNFAITYLGADYLLTPSLLVGGLVQVDWTEESSDAAGSSADGIGVMAGPYLSASIAPNVFFDTRFAWGVSENSVDPFGLYEDNFSTERWLASARLTGNWRMGNFRITPSVGATYVEEDQESYVDSLGVIIPSQTVSLGRLAFGPEIAYRFVLADGSTVEPHFAVTGLWDFDNPGTLSVGGLTAGDDDLHALVRAGILARSARGASFRVVGTYDGIGSDFDAFGGQVWLNIPLR